MQQIAVLVKQPGKPCKLTKISNDLYDFQKLVGGYIECCTITDTLVAIINEDGKFKEKEPNIPLFGGSDWFVGTVVFCSRKGEELDSITANDMDWLSWFFGGE